MNIKKLTDKELEKLDIHLRTLFEYGINLRDRVITLIGEIDEHMFKLVDAGLSEMESYNNQKITIRLNSGGGSVYDALAIVGRMQASKCRIAVEGYGHIMSAATLILAAGHPGYRKISAYAWHMHHETVHYVEESSTIRTSQLKADLVQEEKEHKKWCKAMADFTNQDVNFWLAKGIGVDFFMDAEELLKNGIVDEII